MQDTDSQLDWQKAEFKPGRRGGHLTLTVPFKLPTSQSLARYFDDNARAHAGQVLGGSRCAGAT